jgi:hypothetical protein
MIKTEPMPAEPKPVTGSREEFRVSDEQLVTTVKKMLHEGNVRHIVIKQEGSTIMEMPLTFGVVGVLAGLGCPGSTWRLDWTVFN